ncbi:Fanconi anemia group F protein [Echeneis naucrates]|uniref:FA complementation group F n=1 Tax=Echeneis naucrates TaxID=173247 RepID=A0A665V643_ECHNA|nr:Fanconi anemia group F protein [Echeneis naucrates]
MEAVLKNLADTVELLAVAALCGVVEQWDTRTVSRAFHWARYCERLFNRFQDNAEVRKLMEKQIQLTNESLRAALPGYTEVSILDLSMCQQHLLVGLLSNPKLPSSIMKTLFDNNSSPAEVRCGVNPDVTGLCSFIIQCKSACQVLSPLTDSSAVGADAEVQADMLMERLGVLMSQRSGANRIEYFLDSVLQGCEGATEHFCLMIAAALLTRRNSAAESASQDVLLDWLQKRQNTLQHMCSALATALLMDLAKEHLKFRDSFCDVLKSWASDMEYNISEGEWVQRSTHPRVSFQKLTEHFHALFETCPCLRNEVGTELNALKISDGDFDVRGLSVWGDLLSALNR